MVAYQAILLIVGNEAGPKNALQTAYATIVIFLGSIVTAFIFGNMAALLSTINKRENLLQEQLDLVQ